LISCPEIKFSITYLMLLLAALILDHFLLIAI